MPSSDLFQPGDVFSSYSIADPCEQRDSPVQCYFAMDTRTDRPVMLHCLDRRPPEDTPEQAARFTAMLARLRALRTDILAAFVDGGVTDRVYWAATEHKVGGVTLESLLGDPGARFPIPACFMIAAELAVALREANDAGIRHLRLHPGRILVRPERFEVEKLLNIGIADLFSFSPAIIRSDPLYAAPEQLRDKGKGVDERADIYGLGMVLYTMLAWSRPCADKDGRLPGKSKQLLFAMTQMPPLIGDRRKQFPDFVDVFVQSVVAKSRSHRPASWAAFYKELHDIVGRWAVWCDAMDELGNVETAKRRALIAALQGPAPEGTELHMMLAGLLGAKALGPGAQKPKKPQSGERPSAALRAGMEGYRTEEGEDDEAVEGTVEPEWLAALPEAEADEEPRAEARPEVRPESRVEATPEVEPEPRTKAEEGEERSGPRAGNLEPPTSEAPPHDTGSDAMGSGHFIDPATLTQDGAPPVTLPSGQLVARKDAPGPRYAQPRRVALAVAALALLGSLVALVVVIRGAGERPTLAQSAAIRAARPSEARSVPLIVAPLSPEPSASSVAVIPTASTRRALPHPSMPPTPVAAPSASERPPSTAPTAAPKEDDDLCVEFFCASEIQSLRARGDSLRR